MIIQKYQIQWTISKQDLDTIKNLALDGDILINKQSKERIKIKIKNDTILVSESKIDTLFRLSKDNLARKFKGNLILNYKQDDDSWRVEIYSLRWRTMKFMTINSKTPFGGSLQYFDESIAAKIWLVIPLIPNKLALRFDANASFVALKDDPRAWENKSLFMPMARIIYNF